ncbi:Ubiquitin-like domain superfamily [Sesbania bispinosa]|nr:Ubiquitin-like domain superfamily [Sesbania bispinosa]
MIFSKYEEFVFPCIIFVAFIEVYGLKVAEGVAIAAVPCCESNRFGVAEGQNSICCCHVDQEEHSIEKLMNAYFERKSVGFNSIAFLFDGCRLRAVQTPDELEMEDGDEIDAILQSLQLL